VGDRLLPLATANDRRLGYPLNLPALDVPALLRQYGLRPDKKLGQNFLIEPAALERVVAAAGNLEDQVVLEIGPGLGGLTRLLAARARKVIAVEIDENLIPPLERVLSGFENVSIVCGDILKLDPAILVKEPDYFVVANIPYYITSALLRHLLEAEVHPNRMVLTVQQEVAERICASPGDMSLLALGVQVYGHPRMMFRISAGSFYPAPKVDSAVVRVDFFPEPRIPAYELEIFFRLAKAGFSQKRKTLRNALAAGLGLPAGQAEAMLDKAGVDPRRRAETLDLDEWNRLVEVYRGGIPGRSDVT
jgi:16S rRNA (adenine1518-N6/adenine1519-N6)-dimethyltransferase